MSKNVSERPQIIKVVLENVKNDVSIYVEIVVHRDVAEADHPYPSLFKCRGNVTVLSQ